MSHSHRKDDDKMKFCLVTVGEIDKKPYAHKFIHMENCFRFIISKYGTTNL